MNGQKKIMIEAADSEEESAIDCDHSHTQACAREGARESIYGTVPD